MIQEILKLASSAEYDFRLTACTQDPLRHLFDQWVPYYRLKWAVARVLQPQRILEIGVRFGYSAATFLNACPNATYLGIDNDSDTFGGHKGAIQWARHITQEFNAEYLIADSQDLTNFPAGPYDLIHLDGQQDGAGFLQDLRKSLKQGKHILVDGYFWTRENFLHVSEFLYRYRDLIESVLIIPGFAGELLITPQAALQIRGVVSSSAELIDTYTDSYYLQNCGGFDAYKRDKGLQLADLRLQAVADLAGTAPMGPALDLGCGRGEVSVHLARMGREVLAVDYSESAIALAKGAGAENVHELSKIRFHCGDVNDAPLSGLYEVAVASDLVEHMTPGELDRLYSRVASHLSPHGLFVVHTFPNNWFYKYEYARRLREARKLGAHLPLEPRTRYEELMHINEQSPRVLKHQLGSHFKYILLWFAAHDLVSPFENLRRPFSKNELRAAGDLFALASHSPIDTDTLLHQLAMHPVVTPIDLDFQLCEIPSTVQAGARFLARVRLTNNSGVELKSRPPNPIHLSYHCYSENGQAVIFDGLRTRISVLKPGFTADSDMELVAPCAHGRFLFRVTLVQEGVRWFDESPQSLLNDHWIEVN